MKIAVAHLYPDYLNIYADRGNIAVLTRRAAVRGHALHVTGVEPGDPLDPSAFDLLYVGGGQDREQALIAPDLAHRGPAIAAAVQTGTAVLAVCGGYQLLGRGYRGRDGSWMPGAGVLPLETVAGARRLIGDVLLEVDGVAISKVEDLRAELDKTEWEGEVRLLLARDIKEDDLARHERTEDRYRRYRAKLQELKDAGKPIPEHLWDEIEEEGPGEEAAPEEGDDEGGISMSDDTEKKPADGADGGKKGRDVKKVARIIERWSGEKLSSA